MTIGDWLEATILLLLIAWMVLDRFDIQFRRTK
jgi:hypothetical protein